MLYCNQSSSLNNEQHQLLYLCTAIVQKCGEDQDLIRHNLDYWNTSAFEFFNIKDIIQSMPASPDDVILHPTLLTSQRLHQVQNPIWHNPDIPSASTLKHIDIADLKQFYTLRDIKEVTDYLHRYPSLIPFLVATAFSLRDYFPESYFALKHFVDPEDPDIEILKLRIATKLSPKNAIGYLARFRNEWWNKACGEAGIENVALGIEPA